MSSDQAVAAMKKCWRKYRLRIEEEQRVCKKREGAYDEKEYRAESVLGWKTAEINSEFIAELEREVLLNL
jgi:hypothetical protein